MSALVRLWDRNFDAARVVDHGWRVDEPGVLAVPLDHPHAAWLCGMSTDAQAWLTVDIDGMRFIQRLDNYEVVRKPFGEGFVKYLRAEFVDDRVAKMFATDIHRLLEAGDAK